MELRTELNSLVMVALIEELYQTNQISEEVKVRLINKYFNK